jgi:hypothetical protein
VILEFGVISSLKSHIVDKKAHINIYRSLDASNPKKKSGMWNPSPIWLAQIFSARPH